VAWDIKPPYAHRRSACLTWREYGKFERLLTRVSLQEAFDYAAERERKRLQKGKKE
jgi:hypothetical protein